MAMIHQSLLRPSHNSVHPPKGASVRHAMKSAGSGALKAAKYAQREMPRTGEALVAATYVARKAKELRKPEVRQHLSAEIGAKLLRAAVAVAPEKRHNAAHPVPVRHSSTHRPATPVTVRPQPVVEAAPVAVARPDTIRAYSGATRRPRNVAVRRAPVPVVVPEHTFTVREVLYPEKYKVELGPGSSTRVLANRPLSPDVAEVKEMSARKRRKLKAMSDMHARVIADMQGRVDHTPSRRQQRKSAKQEAARSAEIARNGAIFRQQVQPELINPNPVQPVSLAEKPKLRQRLAQRLSRSEDRQPANWRHRRRTAAGIGLVGALTAVAAGSPPNSQAAASTERPAAATAQPFKDVLRPTELFKGITDTATPVVRVAATPGVNRAIAFELNQPAMDARAAVAEAHRQAAANAAAMADSRSQDRAIEAQIAEQEAYDAAKQAEVNNWYASLPPFPMEYSQEMLNGEVEPKIMGYLSSDELWGPGVEMPVYNTTTTKIQNENGITWWEGTANPGDQIEQNGQFVVATHRTSGSEATGVKGLFAHAAELQTGNEVTYRDAASNDRFVYDYVQTDTYQPDPDGVTQIVAQDALSPLVNGITLVTCKPGETPEGTQSLSAFRTATRLRLSEVIRANPDPVDYSLVG